MRQSDKYINRHHGKTFSMIRFRHDWWLSFHVNDPISTRLMTIVPWIPNLAKLLCATRALTFYFHCTIFQLSAQIVHGAGLSRTLRRVSVLLFIGFHCISVITIQLLFLLSLILTYSKFTFCFSFYINYCIFLLCQFLQPRLFFLDGSL